MVPKVPSHNTRRVARAPGSWIADFQGKTDSQLIIVLVKNYVNVCIHSTLDNTEFK